MAEDANLRSAVAEQSVDPDATIAGVAPPTAKSSPCVDANGNKNCIRFMWFADWYDLFMPF